MAPTRAWGPATAFLVVSLFSSWLVVEAQITDPSEVDALRAIRRRLEDPQGFLRNWNSGDPCMRNWTDVLCFDEALDDGYHHVRELQMLNRNLSGNLAPELGQLAHMKILDFMWNQISGSIPKEIGNVKTLEPYKRQSMRKMTPRSRQERMGSYPAECVEQFVTLALKCSQDDTDGRPSMAEVVRELENIRRITPEAGAGVSESLSIEPGKLPQTPPSAVASLNLFVSSDGSGSDLVSGR